MGVSRGLPRSLRDEGPASSISDEKSQMSVELNEEDMRLALFGSPKQSDPVVLAKPQPSPTPRLNSKPLSPKLRVTLHVTKDFEGDVSVFIYDANTLSTLIAEQEAKKEAKKRNSNISMWSRSNPSSNYRVVKERASLHCSCSLCNTTDQPVVFLQTFVCM